MTTLSARGPSSVETQVAHRRSAEARAAATAAEAAKPLPKGVLRRTGRLVADIVRKCDRDRVLGLAGENAFMAVLTTFPVLIVVAAVLGQLSLVIGRDNALRVEDSVLRFLQELLTDSAGPAIDTARDLFATPLNTLTLALVLALFSLATAFASIINTVTLTYDVRDHRGWWFRRGLGLVVGLGSVLIAVVVVTLVVVGPLFAAADVVQSIGLDAEYQAVWSWARWPVAFLALVLWATTMFHVCPDRRRALAARPAGRAADGGALAGRVRRVQRLPEDRPRRLAGLRRPRWRPHRHDLAVPAVLRPARRRRAERRAHGAAGRRGPTGAARAAGAPPRVGAPRPVAGRARGGGLRDGRPRRRAVPRGGLSAAATRSWCARAAGATGGTTT